MDINQTTDIKELKSLAFDELVTIEQAQRNVQALQARIKELESTVSTDSTEKQ